MTPDVISWTIQVHKDKEPGLLVSIHEWCVAVEDLCAVCWKQFRKEYPLKFDLLIDNCLLVERLEKWNLLRSLSLLIIKNYLRDTTGICF